MKTKKIFTPMIAVGLAVSLSMGADLNIDPWNTQIENFYTHQFSDGASYIDQYCYCPQGGEAVLLKSLTFSFADRPTPNQLTLQNDAQNNGTIALGGANTVNFEDSAGLWIDGFFIDFSRSDVSQAKQFHLSFGEGNIGSFSAFSGKSSFSVKNGQSQDDIMTVSFSGEVNSDFLIDSKSSNTFTFSKEYDWQTINVTGDIAISADHQNNSKNTFNFNNVTYTGTFTNAISTDTVINLDGSNTQFIGDINTTGGNTTVNFLASEISFQGNIAAENNSINSINISTGTNLGMNLTLNLNGNGKNIVNLDDNLDIGGPGSGDLIVVSSSANTDINIGSNARIELDTFSVTSKKGVTNINFLGETAELIPAYYSVSFTADGGKNIFNFKKDGVFNIAGSINATNGTNRFVIDKKIIFESSLYLYGSSQTLNKNIFDIYGNSSVDFKNNLIVQNGNLEINFNKGSGTPGVFKSFSDTTNQNSTITINLDDEVHGIIKGSRLGNPRNILNFNEKSFLELVDCELHLSAINFSGNEASLSVTSDYNPTYAYLYNAIKGEKLTINFDKGTDSAYPSYLILKSGGNELKALNVVGNISKALDQVTLEQGSTSILDEVNILQNKGVKFILQDNSSSITFKNHLVNSGEVNFRFEAKGGSVNSNIQSNNAGVTTFTFIQTNGIYTINGELSTSGQAQNIFDLTSNGATIGNNLVFYGNEVSEDGGNIINIGANQTLALSSNINGVATTNSITTASGATFLNLKGDNANLEGNASTSGGKTVINFQGNSQISGNLNISSSGETNITVADGKTASFIKPIEVNGNDALLSVNLGNNSTIQLNGGSGNLSNTSGIATLSFNGSGNFSGNITTSSGSSTTFELGKSDGSLDSATITIAGVITNSNNNLATNTNAGENAFSVNATNTTFTYTSQADGLVFSHGQNAILFENNNNATLHWQGADSTDKSISTTGGNTLIEFRQNGTIASGFDTSGGEMTINLYEGKRGVINGEITTTGRGKSYIVFNENNSTLTLKDDATITSVSNLENYSKAYGSNNGISFYHDQRSGKDFKTLVVGTKGSSSDGISGEGLNFVVYATTNETNAKANNSVYSDKIIIHSSSNAGSSTHNLGVRFENQDTINLDAITYTKGGSNNILVASVAKSSKVDFNTQENLVLGFDVANVQYAKEDTDENGNYQANGTYTSYFIGSAKANNIVVAEQEITATAFTLNYDLYMANFNSLNKRMGELRENPHSQGVWARVFNGALSNDFGLGSKSNYTTIQAGYDYAFGFEGANNYLGVALSYALSTSTSNNAYDINGQKRSIDGIYSNAFEIAIYNAYVSDTGWYNDSIAKFSYLLSNFDIKNLNNGESTSNDTKNFALTLSDEVGYRFALGEVKEWSITPQLELGFGYFNQSDFKQTLQNSGAYLSSDADLVLTLRARAGSSFGYDFKNFTQGNSFNASVYVGAFYEYDYVSGGEIHMGTQRGTEANQYSNLSSDGRVVMNVGTNMSVEEHTRIYFDFEKSFMGKINTDYQVNFGVRYSFGESNGYTPQNIETQEESKAPLKIEEKEKIEENKEGENQESISSKENKKQSDEEEKTSNEVGELDTKKQEGK